MVLGESTFGILAMEPKKMLPMNLDRIFVQVHGYTNPPLLDWCPAFRYARMRKIMEICLTAFKHGVLTNSSDYEIVLLMMWVYAIQYGHEHINLDCSW